MYSSEFDRSIGWLEMSGINNNLISSFDQWDIEKENVLFYPICSLSKKQLIPFVFTYVNTGTFSSESLSED